jgi:hypothetical protein
MQQPSVDKLELGAGASDDACHGLLHPEGENAVPD